MERCGKHPAQLLTGICSSCLMERLSTVGKSAAPSEIVEVGNGAPEVPPPPPPHDEGKLRTTLMLLFQLDDSGSSIGAKDPQAAQFGADHGGGDGDRVMRGKSRSWLRSILPTKGMRWRRNGSAGKESSRPPLALSPLQAGSMGLNGGGDRRIDHKPSFRHSCEWLVCREPSRGPVELPRHSWDGSMVSKAFACSFPCLEERADGIARTRRSVMEEAQSGSPVKPGKSKCNGESSVDEGKPNGEPSVGGSGRHLRAQSCDDSQPETEAVGSRSRRSHRWSKVWDWSITSPLKEFVKKGEHVLERSLSESRKDSRKGKRGQTVEIDDKVHAGGADNDSTRSNRCVNRSTHVANGDVQNVRPGWLGNKECKIGRSRSVHYTSPGNLDNGLLRFYLTPMRSSRSTNRGRRRSSRLFARGIFGFI